MEMKAGMASEPSSDLRMLVGRIVICNEVKVELARSFPIDDFEETQPFLVAMPGLALSDDGAVSQIQRRKERGRAMPLVIMSHRAGSSLLHRQAGLRAIKSLYMGLFISAQDQGMLRRIQVELFRISSGRVSRGRGRDLRGGSRWRFGNGVGCGSLEPCA